MDEKTVVQRFGAELPPVLKIVLRDTPMVVSSPRLLPGNCIGFFFGSEAGERRESLADVTEIEELDRVRDGPQIVALLRQRSDYTLINLIESSTGLESHAARVYLERYPVLPGGAKRREIKAWERAVGLVLRGGGFAALAEYYRSHAVAQLQTDEPGPCACSACLWMRASAVGIIVVRQEGGDE